MEILTELGLELGAELLRIYNFVEWGAAPRPFYINFLCAPPPPPPFTPSSGEEKEECYRQTLEQRP